MCLPPQSALQLLSTRPKLRRPKNSFAERFKYDVISSSLLSASLAATPGVGRRSANQDDSSSLEAASDAGERSQRPSSSAAETEDELNAQTSDVDMEELKGPVAVLSIGVVALAAGYEFLAYLLFAAALYLASSGKPAPDKSDPHSLVSRSFLNPRIVNLNLSWLPDP